MLGSSIDVHGNGVLELAHGREHKALTGVNQLHRLITPVTTIAERLKTARLALGLSQKELARLAGVSPGTIGNIEAGARDEPQKLVEIAVAAQVTPGWLKLGKGPMRPPNAPKGHPPSAGLSIRPEDQDLSQPQPDHERPLITGEFLLSATLADLPGRFRLAMPDDAMAPDTPRGTILFFEREKLPAFGAGVLVQDATGGRHVRRYAQGPAGSWKAEARNTAYLTLHSTDGLQLLAVVTAVETSQI